VAAAPKPGEDANLPPVGQVFPPGTVAAVVAHPKPFWKQTPDHPLPAGLMQGLEELTRRTRFDTKQFDRTTVSFTAKPGAYVATGEGGFLNPAWVSDTLSRIPAAEALPSGGAKLKFGPGSGADPQAGVIVPDKIYAVSNDAYSLGRLLRNFDAGPKGLRIADETNPALVAMFSPAERSDPPLLTFAATGPWALPLPDKLTLDQNGIRFAVAEVRLQDQFEVTLTLTGKDIDSVRDFVNLELGKRLTERYQSFKPIVGRFADTKPIVRPVDSDIEYRMRASFTWDEVTNAVAPLFAE
jgi:hypothetical protein